MTKKQQEIVNNVVPIERVPGLVRVFCESGNEYTSFQGDKWQAKIGEIVEIEYEEVTKHGKTKDFVNKQIVEAPTGYAPQRVLPIIAKVAPKMAPQGARDEFRTAFARMEKKVDKILSYMETPEGKLPPEYDF